MLKTFTLDKREEEQLSDHKGVMHFYITDENGDSRVITGSTYLDENQVAQGISSENKRELPLIEGLFRLEIGEQIDIEFDYYNANYDRSTDKTVNQLAFEKVQQMEKEKGLFYHLGRLIKRKSENQLSTS